MNRAERRALEKRIRKMANPARAAKAPKDRITLHGGPMDGWIVKPDAPVLRPEWYDGFVILRASSLWDHERLRRRAGIGPRWQDMPAEQQAPYIEAARTDLPPGRYLVDEGKRDATWRPY